MSVGSEKGFQKGLFKEELMTDKYCNERIEVGFKKDTEADLRFWKGVVTSQKNGVDYSELLLYLEKYPKKLGDLLFKMSYSEKAQWTAQRSAPCFPFLLFSS